MRVQYSHSAHYSLQTWPVHHIYRYNILERYDNKIGRFEFSTLSSNDIGAFNFTKSQLTTATWTIPSVATNILDTTLSWLYSDIGSLADRFRLNLTLKNSPVDFRSINTSCDYALNSTCVENAQKLAAEAVLAQPHIESLRPIPIPATLPLLGSGLALIGFMRRRKKSLAA